VEDRQPLVLASGYDPLGSTSMSASQLSCSNSLSRALSNLSVDGFGSSTSGIPALSPVGAGPSGTGAGRDVLTIGSTELGSDGGDRDRSSAASLAGTAIDSALRRIDAEVASPRELLDADLMRQLAPALAGHQVRSVLAQPLLGADEKVVGCILCVNKREVGSEHDMFFESYYTEADQEAMALFALEVGQTLSERSLECALASALSVVSYDGLVQSGGGTSLGRASSSGATDTSDEMLLRSQLMNMYFQTAPEYKRVSSDNTGLAPVTRYWQRTLSKILGPTRMASLRHTSKSASGGTSRDPTQRLSGEFVRGREPAHSDITGMMPDLATAGSSSAPGGVYESDPAGSSSEGYPPAGQRHFCKSASLPFRTTQLGGLGWLRGNAVSRALSRHKILAAALQYDGPISDPDMRVDQLLEGVEDGEEDDEEEEDALLPETSSDVPSSATMSNGAFGAASAYAAATAASGKALTKHKTFNAPEVIMSWDFDFTAWEGDDLIKLCYDMFLLSGLIDHFNINVRVLQNFITVVASHYHSIPYHNFNHVCHVLHGVWMMLVRSAAAGMLAPEDRLGALIAAICHDLDHDGYSNSYHVNTQSELARIYNDMSVMENHHCAMTFAILRRKECALLDDLQPDVRRQMRKTIVSAILCTDMSNHFTLTHDFKKHPLQFDAGSEGDRLLLLKVLLHAADIGNAVRPFAVNDAMSKRVHREFQAQAEEEARLGLPVTFAVDSTNQKQCSQVELNFLDYVVMPLWERLAEVLPDLQPCWATLAANRARYGELAAVRESFTTTTAKPGPGMPAENAGNEGAEKQAA